MNHQAEGYQYSEFLLSCLMAQRDHGNQRPRAPPRKGQAQQRGLADASRSPFCLDFIDQIAYKGNNTHQYIIADKYVHITNNEL